MEKQRRYLSLLAGKVENTTSKIFRGVYLIKTLHIAVSAFNLNTPNLFFINIENYFITIFITPSKCIVIDGVSIKPVPEELKTFLDEVRGNTPITHLPFKTVNRETSLIFCLLIGVALSKHPNINDIVDKFDFHPNNISRNCEIVNSWFKTRYQ